MKFIYADSLDFIDPNYDFDGDRHSPDRRPYWDDQFSHEYMGYSPYDGLLVSRATVGDHRVAGKYTETQARRFCRVGAAEFLRFRGDLLFGDCGAFSYHRLPEPPYTAEDMVGFYEDGGFTHGCSVDHVIFECDPAYDHGLDVPSEFRQRYEITLANAESFLGAAKRLGNHFTPMGVIQGWSPGSMAAAAQSLEAMGYRYLAVGGMVPLRVPLIKQCLQAIRDLLRPETGMHVLGFAKADHIDEFRGFGISSFDTTSPMLRAFKDTKANYYLPNGKDRISYYTAIRIPQALENNRLKRWAKSGRYRQETLQHLEIEALDRIRALDRGDATVDEALDAIMRYSEPLFFDESKGSTANSRLLTTYRDLYERTLIDRPWTRCTCPVCQRVGVEVIIFRSSNRNKRRGMHNLGVYYKHLKDSLNKGMINVEDLELFSHQGSAE